MRLVSKYTRKVKGQIFEAVNLNMLRSRRINDSLTLVLVWIQALCAENKKRKKVKQNKPKMIKSQAQKDGPDDKMLPSQRSMRTGF